MNIEDEVELLICETFDLGVKVIVNDQFLGIVYNNDVNRKMRRGDYTKGFVYNIREDGKLDIRLEKSGYVKIEPLSQQLLEMLKAKKGTIFLTDKSHPDEIRDQVGMSKKTFKQAVGNLYKNRLITINDDSISLI